ncbi:hypothetical protein AKJ65_02915 [candidate division MSBL1 archaeon SCGC-AAA259E19]|uniref:Uncharacterized protein n=1 Tax=candidate division MSBL1 archaeon SCGC-AAA259E19 TaxID=1698264 RepID=A0A133ULA2_9EURY|nr:hypothetical protein AKJ65_02915 [candidate division MSBL1 archaeon SCGC-AAA259E19]
MNDFPVIGVVGPPASGKTEVASKFEDLGAVRIRMGDIAWEEVKKRGLEVNEKNVGKVSNELREEEGMGAVAKHCIPVIKEGVKENKPVVVDGIRGIAEVEVFEEEFGDNFVLISVEAPPEVRYSRVRGRGREDDTVDWKSFKEKDSRERNWGLEEAMESSDYRIVNICSLDELEKRTSEIYREVMDEYSN